MHSLQTAFPELVALDTLGYSAALRHPLIAMKLSDRAFLREDESTVLITALHHAREPAGMMVSLAVVESLLRRYATSESVRFLLDNLAIWFVPVVNPDGYHYMLNERFTAPWWRKNLRDNDGNGRVDPKIDGVDLNRNYDFNWSDGDGVLPISWFYRGSAPGSEPEIAALQELARRENITAGFSLHSHGEAVLYPWGNFYPPPDRQILITTARRLAKVLRKQADGAPYSVWPLNGRAGQSSVWMYGRLRAQDFILELGTTWFPAPEILQRLTRQVGQAVVLLGEIVLFEGIRGHVFDALTSDPLVCEVRVHGLEAGYVSPRLTDAVFGRFERILPPGKYTVSFKKDGYREHVVKNIKVNSGAQTNFTVYLHRKSDTLPVTPD